MKFHHFAVAIALAVGTVVAFAEAPVPRSNPDRCTDLDDARALNRTLPAHVRVISMSGIEAHAFIAAFNEVPPETNFRGDTVFALFAPQMDVYLAFFDGQCATMVGATMRLDLFRQTLSRAQATIS